MPLRVLVVDDSLFFRRRVSEFLNTDPGIEVIAQAKNGKEAVEMAQELRPDVVTMDVEMPVMDGITAVREIMSRIPTPILMFSSLTQEGAKATLDALEAGAADFLPKEFDALATDREGVAHLLCERVLSIGRRRLRRSAFAKAPVAPRAPAPANGKARPDSRCRLVIIGTSTGGPLALSSVLETLPANFPLPLLLLQHIPAGFSETLATRLDRRSAITVKEAEDGDLLLRGLALLAPGGSQMVLERQGGDVCVRVAPGNIKYRYHPSVDQTFTSAAELFAGDVLAIVMTGMGNDGKEGARILKQAGASVWAQDEESSVVYGMPMAIAQAGLADHILPLDRIGLCLGGAG